MQPLSHAQTSALLYDWATALGDAFATGGHVISGTLPAESLPKPPEKLKKDKKKKQKKDKKSKRFQSSSDDAYLSEQNIKAHEKALDGQRQMPAATFFNDNKPLHPAS